MDKGISFTAIHSIEIKCIESQLAATLGFEICFLALATTNDWKLNEGFDRRLEMSLDAWERRYLRNQGGEWNSSPNVVLET